MPGMLPAPAGAQPEPSAPVEEATLETPTAQGRPSFQSGVQADVRRDGDVTCPKQRLPRFLA